MEQLNLFVHIQDLNLFSYGRSGDRCIYRLIIAQRILRRDDQRLHFSVRTFLFDHIPSPE